MKDNKLTSITEYSDYLETLDVSDSEKWRLHCLRKYFGKNKLQLGDFAPCVNGVPMRKPYKMYSSGLAFSSRKLTKDGHAYKQAQSRVLFEGFEVSEGNVYNGCNYIVKKHNSSFKKSLNNDNIESIVDFQPTLTETALKQLI
jgi:hypothetical protein